MEHCAPGGQRSRGQCRPLRPECAGMAHTGTWWSYGPCRCCRQAARLMRGSTVRLGRQGLIAVAVSVDDVSPNMRVVKHDVSTSSSVTALQCNTWCAWVTTQKDHARPCKRTVRPCKIFRVLVAECLVRGCTRARAGLVRACMLCLAPGW